MSAEIALPPVAGVTGLVLTVWVKLAEVLVLKLPSPLYTAVIVCEPGGSVANGEAGSAAP